MLCPENPSSVSLYQLNQWMEESSKLNFTIYALVTQPIESFPLKASSSTILTAKWYSMSWLRTVCL